MLSDQELQSLRNWGNLAEEAADEICALRAALAAQPAEPVDSIHAELWRLAVRKGVVTVESKLIDDRNPNTRCSWMQGNDKACDISNDAAKVAGDRP